MPCIPHIRPIPINSLHRLPLELIGIIYELVFTPAYCCPAHFLKVLATSKAYYTSRSDTCGYRTSTDWAWDIETFAQTFHHHSPYAPWTGLIPFNLPPPARRLLLWQNRRILRIDSVKAIKMAYHASRRMRELYRACLPPPTRDNLADFLASVHRTGREQKRLIFPCVAHLSLAQSVMRAYYRCPSSFQQPNPPDGIAISVAIDTLLDKLRPGAAVCMYMPNTTSAGWQYWSGLSPEEIRQVFYQALYFTFADHGQQLSSVVLHDLRPADLEVTKTHYVPSIVFELKNKGGDVEDKMEKVKRWSGTFFRQMASGVRAS
ncbi:hypothetical protein IAR50_000916 [Cryptococcus sp. DSM 104548]